MAIDYYTLLGVPFGATVEEIRDAYLAQVRTLHPDANRDPKAREHFRTVERAYQVLADPKKRTDYDSSLPALVRAAPDISIDVNYSRLVVPSIHEQQLTYLLLDFICTADPKTAGVPPGHVCLVLDRSTSMAGARIDMVKTSALNLLQQLRPQDVLSVVGFSDRAEVIIPPTRASLLSKADHRVNFLQPSGGTEIFRGLQMGIEQLRKTDKTFLRHLILLTDGFTYGDDENCLMLADEARDEGISISTLGIGHEWNDVLMDQIASRSGGDSMYINGARDLDQFLTQKRLHIERLYAQGLRLEYTSAPGIQLRSAFRLLPSISSLPVESPLLLGDLQYRRSVSLLLEFLLPPNLPEHESLTLAKGRLAMTIPGRPVPLAYLPFDFSITVDNSAAPDLPSSLVVDAMAKLTLFRMQERVRTEVRDGQIEKATRHMHYLATHLLAQGDRELAHTVLMEAEHIQQSRHFSGDGEKRIKYGTRALLLPTGSEQER